jgi:hypothetical protein
VWIQRTKIGARERRDERYIRAQMGPKRAQQGRKGGVRSAKWGNLLHVCVITGLLHIEFDAEKWVGRIHGVQRIDLLEYLT